MWTVAIVVVVLLTVAGLAVLRRIGGTLYVFRHDGFTAFGRRPDPPHNTDEQGLEKAIARLLPGDVFDMLWISTREDEYGGLILTVESGVPVLQVDFKTQSEQVRLKGFREDMASHGLTGSEDSNGFSGGSGEEFRVTTIEYRLANQPTMVKEAVEAALSNLEPGYSSGYYVRGSSLGAIVGSRPGLKFIPASDPLSDL